MVLFANNHKNSSQTVPDAPTGLAARTVAVYTVTLEWDDPSDASITGYEILRRHPATQDPGVFSVIASTETAATSYVDATVEPANEYVYGVKARNASGASGTSDHVTVTTSDGYSQGASCWTCVIVMKPSTPSVNEGEDAVLKLRRFSTASALTVNVSVTDLKDHGEIIAASHLGTTVAYSMKSITVLDDDFPPGVKFTASADKTTVKEGESTTLTFTFQTGPNHKPHADAGTCVQGNRRRQRGLHPLSQRDHGAGLGF